MRSGPATAIVNVGLDEARAGAVVDEAVAYGYLEVHRWRVAGWRGWVAPSQGR